MAVDLVSADRHERLEAYLRSEDFFEDLPVLEDSQEVLAKLSQHYEIFIATAAMEFPNSFGPKYRWLRRHFPFIPPTNFVFCGDKSILLADYLIDDTFRHFERFKGQGILFPHPIMQPSPVFAGLKDGERSSICFCLWAGLELL